MKYYKNIEDGTVTSLSDLEALFKVFEIEDPENFGQGFDYFLECATGKDGALREVKTRLFKDIERNILITEDDLKREFDDLKSEDPTEYNYNFSDYIKNCTDKNGFLEEVIK